ncbi:MAG: class I SAM-dependent methyltransferase [Actinomycetota bacterium]
MTPEGGTGPKDIVRRGYDRISRLYRADDASEGRYAPWISLLLERLSPTSAVLDLGCGCGVPVSRALVAAGHAVTGIDFSPVQIERARELVPGARFQCVDASQAEFPAASFDAVVCLYALIHIPMADQPPLLAAVARWLKPGGWLLATTGQDAWTGSDPYWLGGDAEMWWSHPDAATYRAWIGQAGLTVEAEEFVPEGDSGHALFWARR